MSLYAGGTSWMDSEYYEGHRTRDEVATWERLRRNYLAAGILQSIIIDQAGVEIPIPAGVWSLPETSDADLSGIVQWEGDAASKRGPVFILRQDVTSVVEGAPFPPRSVMPPASNSPAAKGRGPSNQSDRFPGRPSVKSEIIKKIKERAAAAELLASLAGEARWLYNWAHTELGAERGIPSTVRTVENQIREYYRQAKSTSVDPTK